MLVPRSVALLLLWTLVLTSCGGGDGGGDGDGPTEPSNPVVTGVNPTTVVAGDVVTISGSNFGNDPGQVTVVSDWQVLSVTPTSISVRVPSTIVGSWQIVVTIAGRTAVGPTLLVIRNVAGPFFVRSVFGNDFCDLLTDAEEDGFENAFDGQWGIQQNGVQLTVTHGGDIWTGVLHGIGSSEFEARIVEDETTDLGLQFTFSGFHHFTGVLTFIGKNPGHDPHCDFTINLTGTEFD